jgi:hypothetical protein
MADEAGLAREITATADEALQKAAEVIQRRGVAANQGLQAATDALRKSEEQAAAIEKADPTDRARLLAETAKAAGEALKASYTAVDATYSGTPNADAKDEWKECRATIDRFDKLLVDLRKTGFGIVTALVAAATFMFRDGSLGLRISILCMLVLLIITLYTIDRVHQVWLGITVNHAKILECRIGFGLTRAISEKFEGRDATLIGFVLYFVMLVATCAMMWSSIPLTEEHILGGHRIVIYVAASTGLIWMASLQLSDSIQAFRSKLLLGMGVLIVIVILYVLLKS